MSVPPPAATGTIIVIVFPVKETGAEVGDDVGFTVGLSIGGGDVVGFEVGVAPGAGPGVGVEVVPVVQASRNTRTRQSRPLANLRFSLRIFIPPCMAILINCIGIIFRNASHCQQGDATSQQTLPEYRKDIRYDQSGRTTFTPWHGYSWPRAEAMVGLAELLTTRLCAALPGLVLGRQSPWDSIIL